MLNNYLNILIKLSVTRVSSSHLHKIGEKHDGVTLERVFEKNIRNKTERKFNSVFDIEMRYTKKKIILLNIRG